MTARVMKSRNISIMFNYNIHGRVRWYNEVMFRGGM